MKNSVPYMKSKIASSTVCFLSDYVAIGGGRGEGERGVILHKVNRPTDLRRDEHAVNRMWRIAVYKVVVK